MNRQLAAIALAVLFLVPLGSHPGPSFAQSGASAPAADLEARVASIVGRFPGETASVTTALCAELVALGPAGLARTFALVLPPGAGNDAKARFAVNGLAVHVTRSGAEAERRTFVMALLAASAASGDETVAAFFIEQIQLAGRSEAVKPLARYLPDKDLAAPAAAALRAIGGPEAVQVLLKALDAAPLGAKVSIVDALGALRGRKAVKKLLGLAEERDDALRRAALSALAEIGDPAAGPVLSKVGVTAPFGERAAAPALYLRFARRLAEQGLKGEAVTAARSLLRSYGRPEESHIAAAALSLVVDVFGDGAFDDLRAAAEGPVPALRAAALELARPLGGDHTTARWAAAAKAARPDVRAAIVGMLGLRGDASVLPFVRASLADPDPGVRLAAIPAAARLGGTQVLPDLLELAGRAGEEEAAALRAALLGYDGRAVVPAAAALVDATPHPGQAVLIDVLGEKGAAGEIDRLFVLAGDDEPATRAAALGALAKLAREADLPRLVALLEGATDADDILRLQEAVAAAAGRETDPGRRGSALVDLLRDAAPARKVAILLVLPRVGGERALGAAIAETAAPDTRVQTAAVYALSQWPDFAAAGELRRIAVTTGSKRWRLLAVEGYVRLVGRADLAGPRKVALFEDLLAQPFDDADKKLAVAGAAAVREPEALRLVGRYLDHPDLGETAAAGLLELASEQAPHERWLSGHEAYSLLRRVQARAAGDPAEYARIGALVAERLRQGGFTPLFDGRSLAGWKGLVADPPARAGMTPEALARAQEEADGRMRAHWKAVDGVLVFDGRGESLCTAADYADFELLVDWKIGKGGDSGVYLRGSPQVQIWDAEVNPAGSGGLYNNQEGKSQPLERADRPVGEWNAFRIVMIGERVTVYLNDRLVADSVVLENYWERGKPIDPSGQIELQAHGNPLEFRNVFIREIPRDTAVPGLTPAEAEEGFRPLFNGRDLAGWTGGGGGYAAEDGKIVVRPERGGGNLYTDRDYADFVLRFELKLAPAANNGLGVRAPLEGDAAYAGLELQILEDGSPIYWGLRPTQYHGSVYGVVPARRGFLKPPGEWNAQEVTVRGRRVTVVVNGSTVVDADIDEAAAGGTADGRDHPGLKRESGRIGFLGHGSAVEFRNIRIKELE